MSTTPLAEVEPTVEVDEVYTPLVQRAMRLDGTTQTYLAARWDRDEALVSKWLRNDRPMPYHLLVDLAIRLRMKPTDLARLKVVGAACEHCPHCRELAAA